MDKTEVVTKLKLAVVSHRAWVSNAQALIDGIPLDKEKVPVNARECEFGKWYYGDGQRLQIVPGFNEIEEPHDKLHETYMEIFGLLYGEENKKLSFFSKLIGRAQKAAFEKKAAAEEKALLLQEQSAEVIAQLEHLQRVINALGEKQLSGYLA